MHDVDDRIDRDGIGKNPTKTVLLITGKDKKL